jgi:2-amino-4-hydroxy-6-hydroxymethyldihydropteridine diphosphokinase
VTDVPSPYAIDADTLTGDVRPVRRAVLGLGSNMGDRLDYLQGAVDALADSPEIWPVKVSSVYETEPVGGPPDQMSYLNAVLIVDTTVSARTLLERAIATEDAFDRVRDVRWGPRTLDIDILALGDRVLNDADLTVPHPRIAERAFVLVPWAEIDPDFEVPGAGRVAELLAAVSTKGVRRLADVRLDLD